MNSPLSHRISLVATALLLASNSLAAPRIYQDKKNGSFSVDAPESWQDAKELFGMPLTILGPYDSKVRARPTILFSPTGIGPLSLDSETLKDTQEDYKKGREAWVKGLNGKVLEYFKYKNEQFPNANVHRVGFRYEVSGRRFTEESLYMICGKNKMLYHAKVLYRDELDDHAKEVESILRSFSCS